jgi:acetylornithine/succinyldiaminopimelate/putrescine aminotransferase
VAGTLTNSKVVRIEPALNIPDRLIGEVLSAIEDTLKEVDDSTPDIQKDEDS